MSRKRLPFHSHTMSLRSRVVPLVSCTTVARVDVNRLISVDLPTFGKPTIATVPSSEEGSDPLTIGSSNPLGCVGSVSWCSFIGVRACLDGRCLVARPAAGMDLGEPVEEHVDAA